MASHKNRRKSAYYHAENAWMKVVEEELIARAKIERKLKDLGFTIVKTSESAIVKGREGPLEESAEVTFEQIGAELTKML